MIEAIDFRCVKFSMWSSFSPNRPKITVSSAYLMITQFSLFGPLSLSQMVNREALNTHPWGAPVFMVVQLEKESLNRTYCSLPVRNLWIHIISFEFTFLSMGFLNVR